MEWPAWGRPGSAGKHDHSGLDDVATCDRVTFAACAEIGGIDKNILNMLLERSCCGCG